MAAQNVCRYNKYGYCKFGEICRKLHVDELCVESACDQITCDKRHPKECKYYTNYRRCKFNPCKFAHKENIHDVKFEELVAKVDTIEETLKAKQNVELKIKEMDDRLEVLQREIKVIESGMTEKQQAVDKVEFENFVRCVENKVERFECNLTTMRKALSEKDNTIEKLEKRIDEVVNVSEKQSVKIEQLVKKIKEISEVAVIPIQKFKCRNCDFETTSEKGLKQHTSKKHTKSEYKGTTFRCEDCFFLGNSKETLEIHKGKHHTDNFECGLCENTFGNRENLDIHLNTCEIYRCSKCQKKESTIKAIENHVINLHDSQKYLMIDNFKISRENSEETTWRDFYFKLD